MNKPKPAHRAQTRAEEIDQDIAIDPGASEGSTEPRYKLVWARVDESSDFDKAVADGWDPVLFDGGQVILRRPGA